MLARLAPEPSSQSRSSPLPAESAEGPRSRKLEMGLAVLCLIWKEIRKFPKSTQVACGKPVHWAIPHHTCITVLLSSPPRQSRSPRVSTCETGKLANLIKLGKIKKTGTKMYQNDAKDFVRMKRLTRDSSKGEGHIVL